MNPIPLPTGPLTTPLSKLAALVAESATFRAAVGAADSTAALTKIHFPCLATPYLRDALPCAVLQQGPSWSLEQVAGGSQNWLWPAPGSSIRLILADCDRYPKDLEASGVAFLNYCGGVLQDLADLAGRDDRLDVTGIRQEVAPVLPSQEEDKAGAVWWKASFLIAWR